MKIFIAVIISLLFNLQARAELVFKQDGEVVSGTVLAGKGVDVDIEVSGEAEKIYRATRASGLSVVSDTCGLKQFASDSCIITVNSQNASGQLTFKYQDPSRRIKILKFSFIEAGDNLEVRSGAVNGQIDLGLLENNVSIKKIITLKNSGGTTLNLSMDLANTSVSFLNNSCLGELAPAKECKFTIEVDSSGIFEGGNAISVKNNGTELLNIPVLFEVSNEEPTDEFAAEPEKSLDEECLANATTAQEALKCSLSGSESEEAVLSIKDLNCDETNTCTQNMEYQSKAFPIILDITLIYKDIIERACVVDDLRIKGLVLDSVTGASGIVSGVDISGCLVSACEVGFDVAPDSLSCLPAGVELCTLANANEGGVILTGEVLSVEGVLPSCSVTSCAPLFDIAGDQKSCVAQTRACTLADAQVNGADITSAISAAGTVSAADVSQCVISTCEAEFSVAGDQKSCQANAVACTLANANEGGVILTSEVLAVSGDLPSCSVTQCAPLFDVAGDQKSCVAQTRACTLTDAQSNGADILNAFSAVGTVSAADVSQCVIGACNENYNVAVDQKSCSAEIRVCNSSDLESNGGSSVGVISIKGSVVAGDVTQCLVNSCDANYNLAVDEKSCTPIACTLANSGISNATAVSGDLASGCTLVSCEQYYIKNGNVCEAETRACTLTDAELNGVNVEHALSAKGTVVANDISSCKILTCETNYVPKNGGMFCGPRACNSGDIPNSYIVSGDIINGCTVSSCNYGYTVENNACVAYNTPNMLRNICNPRDIRLNSIFGVNPNNVLNVGLTKPSRRIYQTGSASAVLTSDGSVKVWGDISNGGNQSIVDALGIGSSGNVSEIYNNRRAFAVLTSDGNVKAWGNASSGGNQSEVDALGISGNAELIYPTSNGFIVKLSNGDIKGWGFFGTDFNSFVSSNSLNGNVREVYPLDSKSNVSLPYVLFLKNNGSAVIFGAGFNTSVVDSQLSGLTNIVDVVPGDKSWTVFLSNGSAKYIGNGPYLAINQQISTLNYNNLEKIIASENGFLALTDSHTKIVSWGENYGGNYTLTTSDYSGAFYGGGVKEVYANQGSFQILPNNGSNINSSCITSPDGGQCGGQTIWGPVIDVFSVDFSSEGYLYVGPSLLSYSYGLTSPINSQVGPFSDLYINGGPTYTHVMNDGTIINRGSNDYSSIINSLGINSMSDYLFQDVGCEVQSCKAGFQISPDKKSCL